MPIIGSGDIASALEDRDDRLYFASGVSNSQETDEDEYRREVDLLMEQPRNEHIVYFSSLAVLDGVSRYLRHKRHQEWLVKQEFEPYTIVRLGNITWGDNPNTLINHLKMRMEAGETYEVRDVYRHLVDKDEFKFWMERIPDWSAELSITGQRLKVAEVVRLIELGLL